MLSDLGSIEHKVNTHINIVCLFISDIAGGLWAGQSDILELQTLLLLGTAGNKKKSTDLQTFVKPVAQMHIIKIYTIKVGV